MSLGWIGGHVLGTATSRPIKLDGPQDTGLNAALLQKGTYKFRTDLPSAKCD